MRLIRNVDKTLYHVICVSPRNHFVFTPLLASTAVGTLEFRNVCEPVRQSVPSIEFLQAECPRLDIDWRIATCGSVFQPRYLISGFRFSSSPSPTEPPRPSDTDPTADDPLNERQLFDVEFDDVVIAAGAGSDTFGTPGIEEQSLFLKETTDAQRIRQRIVHNFEVASTPSSSTETIHTLLRHADDSAGGPTADDPLSSGGGARRKIGIGIFPEWALRRPCPPHVVYCQC